MTMTTTSSSNPSSPIHHPPGEAPLLVKLDDAASKDPRVVGGKAAALSKAIASGFPVPPGFVMTTTAQTRGPRAFERELEVELSTSRAQRFAVRSSAVCEDGAFRSFAGQLETVLDVPADGVKAAIEHCWASANALRALRYGTAGGGPGGVAVIVQQMVAAESAGVAFSADPKTGERGIVVLEAVTGLGDKLVSGACDPEAWRIDTSGTRRTRTTSSIVLEAAQAQQVAELATKLERLFGRPQDVEWAWANGQLYLLQSRPISALPAAPIALSATAPEGGWDRDDHHAVLSPLGWSWFQPYPKAMAGCMREVGVPVDAVEITRVAGHLYLRFKMSGPENAKLPPRWVLWLASRLIPAMRKGNKLAADFIGGETYMQLVQRWEQEWRPELQQRIDSLFIEEPGTLSNDELLERIGRVLALTETGLYYHAQLGGPGVFSFGKLTMFVEDELRWTPERARTLVTGSSPKTTELHRQIEAIVRENLAEVRHAPDALSSFAALAIQCPKLASALTSWLRTNRLRILHYDPKHSTLGERPDYILSIAQSIADDLVTGASPVQASHEAEETEREAAAALDPNRLAEFKRLLIQARSVYGLRDENGIETVSRPAGLLRHFVLELGRRLPQLTEPEHAVYLYAEEHGPALRGEMTDLADVIERRRGEESWAEQNRPPKRLGPPAAPMPPFDVFPSGLAQAMRILSIMMKSEELHDPSPDGTLKGIGLGNRIVKGPARVINRPEELVRLRHGEILVCRITSPEWSVGLGRVAGIVTDEGGALSHPAIIAREFGIPAILGVANGTRTIATGDILQLDPVTGVVSRLVKT